MKINSAAMTLRFGYAQWINLMSKDNQPLDAQWIPGNLIRHLSHKEPSDFSRITLLTRDAFVKPENPTNLQYLLIGNEDTIEYDALRAIITKNMANRDGRHPTMLNELGRIAVNALFGIYAAKADAQKAQYPPQHYLVSQEPKLPKRYQFELVNPPVETVDSAALVS